MTTCPATDTLLRLRCDLPANHPERFHMQDDGNGTHAWGFELGATRRGVSETGVTGSCGLTLASMTDQEICGALTSRACPRGGMCACGKLNEGHGREHVCGQCKGEFDLSGQHASPLDLPVQDPPATLA